MTHEEEQVQPVEPDLRPPILFRIDGEARPREVQVDPQDGHFYGWVRLIAEPIDDAALGRPSPRAARPKARRPRVPDLDGHDFRPDPMAAQTAEAYLQAMRDLQAWADLSYRDLEDLCGRACSHSAFWNAMNKQPAELPRLTVVGALVTACGGSADDFQRWATALRRIRRLQSKAS
jgi:hypothetical protein